MLRLWDKTVIKEIKKQGQKQTAQLGKSEWEEGWKRECVCVCLLAGSISADCLSTCTAVIKSSSHLAVERERERAEISSNTASGEQNAPTFIPIPHISAPPPQLSHLPHSQGKHFFPCSSLFSPLHSMHCTDWKKFQWTAWLHDFMPAVTFTV